MPETLPFEVLSSESNACVDRHPGRHFPGILIQGDSLRILLQDVTELKAELSSGDAAAATGISAALAEQLTDLLTHYERTLYAAGLYPLHRSRLPAIGTRLT